MKYISVLRGINVSGQKKIIMRDLQSLYLAEGFEDVATYIQSGNVIFTSGEKNTGTINNKIEKAIVDQYGFNVAVEIRTHNDIAKIIKNCPFGKVDLSENGTKVMLSFLSRKPSQAAVDELLEFVISPEELVIEGAEVYLFCPNGYGKTKLSNNFIEKKLNVTATIRNWKTIHKLHELSA